MNYSYNYPSAIIITDTATHTGRFGKLKVLSGQAVIGTIIAENMTENGDSNTITNVLVKQAGEIEGIMTSITTLKN